MAKKKRKSSSKSAASGGKKDKTWAFLGTLPILGYILALMAGKKDKYVMFYAKQGLALGLVYLVVNIALVLLVFTIPLTFIWNLICFVLWILSAMNAFSGQTKATPWIGALAKKF